jgi:hypothetical protein
MDVSQILNPGDRSDESKWLAGFINWREDFFLDQMSLHNYERTKLKEELSYIRRDIEKGILLSSIGWYRKNLGWLHHYKRYPHIQTEPYEREYVINNIFYYSESKNERRCLFLEIQEHKSDYKDFFLSLNNSKKTGQICPICCSRSCTVQVEVVPYPDIPKEAFLTAKCNNPQCRDVGKNINELDYWKELEKMCVKEIKSNRLRFLKELVKPLSYL